MNINTLFHLFLSFARKIIVFCTIIIGKPKILLLTSHEINCIPRAKNTPIVECNTRNYMFGPRGKYHREFRGFALHRASLQCDFFRKNETSGPEEKIAAKSQLRVVSFTIKVLPWEGLTIELERKKSNLCRKFF